MLSGLKPHPPPFSLSRILPMPLLDLADAAGLALPLVTLLWTAALGVLLHAGYPPPSEDIVDAVLAASFAP
jgi:hypothetical protein